MILSGNNRLKKKMNEFLYSVNSTKILKFLRCIVLKKFAFLSNINWFSSLSRFVNTVTVIELKLTIKNHKHQLNSKTIIIYNNNIKISITKQ